MNKIMKWLSGGITASLLMLPMSSQAGLMVSIDDLGTGGLDFSASDEGANDETSGAPGLLDINYNSGSGTFNITASSDAPLVGLLTDIQSAFSIAANTSWEIRVSDDSFTLGNGDQLFQSLVTPTNIRSGITVNLTTYVDGQVVLSAPGLASGVDHSNIELITLSEPSLIEHVVTITAGSSPATGQNTFDTSTAAVPEPATISLLGFALLGLGLWRRKTAA